MRSNKQKLSFLNCALHLLSSTCQCVQSMQCDEPIVDVRYELNGAIIVVVLEHTGAYLYSTGPDAALKMHLKLPPR